MADVKEANEAKETRLRGERTALRSPRYANILSVVQPRYRLLFAGANVPLLRRFILAYLGGPPKVSIGPFLKLLGR